MAVAAPNSDGFVAVCLLDARIRAGFLACRAAGKPCGCRPLYGTLRMPTPLRHSGWVDAAAVGRKALASEIRRWRDVGRCGDEWSRPRGDTLIRKGGALGGRRISA